MSYTVNGERRTLQGSVSLESVLRQEGVNPETASGVAVAVNDRVVRKASWPDATVQPGDRVEIVTARQGG